MSSNFKNFEIETDEGRIQNVSSLCSYIINTPLETDDITYLETLRRKLANNSTYTNKDELVSVLNEVLLRYYIKEYNFDIDQITDVLEVFNKSFFNIEKKVYGDSIFLIFDEYDDIDISLIKDEDEFKDLVLANLKVFVSGTFDEILELVDRTIGLVNFKETNDKDVKEYAETFDISDRVYHGVDSHGNELYKIKNGCLIKDDGELKTLVAPTLLDKEEQIQQKIVSKNKKYQGFDLEEFITLRNKAMTGDFDDESEVQKFYYEVRYLINTMSKRNGLDSEASEALDEYMASLIQIYENHKDILTPADKNNVQDYLANKEKYTRKAA